MDNPLISNLTNHVLGSIKVKERILNDDELLEKILEVVKLKIRILRSGNKIIFAGNGGSAADSQHLAAEYVSKLKKEREPLAAIALTTDTSAITAISNDYDFKKLFSRQLKAISSKGDVFVGISTSGNSSNIIDAFEECKSLNLHSIGFFGQNSGLCSGKVDFELNIPSDFTAHIQEAHIMIGHIICSLVEDEIFF